MTIFSIHCHRLFLGSQERHSYNARFTGENGIKPSTESESAMAKLDQEQA